MRSSNLRNIFYHRGTPQVIQNCEPIFQRLIRPKSRSTLVSDILQFDHDDDVYPYDDDSQWTFPEKSSVIPDDLRGCIRATFDADYEVISLSHLTIGGRTYSTSTKHLGNSHILLKSGIPGQLVPARIDYITQVMVPCDRQDMAIAYIAARKYRPLNLANDPFRAYPCLQAELWSEDLSDLELYPLDSIKTHFVSLPVLWEGQSMMVAVSLSRVSPLLIFSMPCLPKKVGVVTMSQSPVVSVIGGCIARCLLLIRKSCIFVISKMYLKLLYFWVVEHIMKISSFSVSFPIEISNVFM